MFIVIAFGYKQQKIFAIDCLTASLMDCIWLNCVKEIIKLLITKEEEHNKEISSLQKSIVKLEAKIEQLDQKIEDELKKEGGEQIENKKKDDKKGKAGKKGKEVVSNNPLEIQKQESEAQLTKSKENIIKYEEKLVKLKVYKEKYESIDQATGFFIELLDKTGERKFVKTKLDIIANTFLTDKTTYVLCQVFPSQAAEDEDKIEVCEIEGFCVRTCDQDVGAIDEPLVQVKKDDKKKGGKKK